MCIRNSEYLKTTTGKVYKAWRSWTVTIGGKLNATFQSPSLWNGPVKHTPRVVAATGSDIGLHSLASRADARGFSTRNAFGLVEVSGKVAVMARRCPCSKCSMYGLNKVVGYLSTRQRVLKIYLPKRAKRYAAAMRKRYKVPVVLV